MDLKKCPKRTVTAVTNNASMVIFTKGMICLPLLHKFTCDGVHVDNYTPSNQFLGSVKTMNLLCKVVIFRMQTKMQTENG